SARGSPPLSTLAVQGTTVSRALGGNPVTGSGCGVARGRDVDFPPARSTSEQVATTQFDLQMERDMTTNSHNAGWATTAVLIGRLIFAAVFIMAVSFKLTGIEATAGYIAAAGFPMPKLLPWLAALFELALIAGFLTGAYFSEVALLAAAYVLFLAFAFHGP